MGLSASQAKLLTITARLADNELRAQFTTNSKVRLADESNAASAEYMRALDSTNFMYSHYDAYGDKNNIKLTAGAIMEYSELKNQYGLINRYGQILVSSQDKANYTRANSLSEFLEINGVKMVDKPVGILDKISEVLSKNAQVQSATDATAALPLAQAAIQGATVAAGMMDTSIIPEGPLTDAILEKIQQAQTKFTAAQARENVYSLSAQLKAFIGDGTTGDTGLVTTVLDATKDIINITKPNYPASGEPDKEDAMIKTAGIEIQSLQDRLSTLTSLIDSLDTNIATAALDKDCQIESTQEQAIRTAYTQAQNAIDEATEFYKTALIYYGPNKNQTAPGRPSDSSIQAYIDAGHYDDDFYIPDGMDPTVQRYGNTVPTDNIMMNAAKKANDAARGKYVNDEAAISSPFMDDKYPGYLDGEVYNNTTRPLQESGALQAAADINMTSNLNVVKAASALAAQAMEDIKQAYLAGMTDPRIEWYTNLWYRMGSVDNLNKAPDESKYKVLEDSKMNNEAWLKHSLENGIVSMEQVIFNEQGSENHPNLTNREWKSIKYSSSSDITEQEDKTRVARAEIKYEKSLREIQAKDKQYDQDLKKLDTQHNALQTEYESLKSVIDKNVERSFKAFS